jgi:hypothetical protein
MCPPLGAHTQLRSNRNRPETQEEKSAGPGKTPPGCGNEVSVVVAVAVATVGQTCERLLHRSYSFSRESGLAGTRRDIMAPHALDSSPGVTNPKSRRPPR